MSIEDGLAEDDWPEWKLLPQRLGRTMPQMSCSSPTPLLQEEQILKLAVLAPMSDYASCGGCADDPVSQQHQQDYCVAT